MTSSGAARIPESRGNDAGKTRGEAGSAIVWAGFIGSFLVAYLLFSFIGSFFAPSSGAFAPVTLPEGDDVFADALIVKGPANAVRIEDSAKLTPLDDKDFLFFIWFKLRESLQKEERVYLMGKYDPESRDRIGYGLSLVGGLDGVRPQVYWQGAAGPGNWHTFAAAKMKPQQWYLLGVSFREHKLLGVHLATLGNESKPVVLGGFSVDGTGSPTNASDLVVGAFGSSFFHGRVGPFGIIQSKGFSDNVSGFLKELASEPTKLPASAGAEEVALWATPRRDLGPHSLPILNARTSREMKDKKDSR